MSIYGYILTMAAVTYLIRALPLTVYNKPIRSRFMRSMLAYVPYAVLAAMTFPAILFSTNHVLSGIAGFVAALILAFANQKLIVVALAGSGAVFLVEQLLSRL